MRGGVSWRLPASAFAVLALLAAFDHSAIGPAGAFGLYALPGLVCAAAVVAVALRWPGRGTTAAWVAEAVSLTASVTALTGAPAGQPATGTWLYTETGSLLALTLDAVWHAPVRRAAGTAAAGVVASALVVVRFDALAGSSGIESAALLWAMFGLLAAGLGLWLRTVDARRVRAVDDIRRAERLDLARDLHDFVAHHISGMVVQSQAARLVAARDPARAVEALEEIEEAGTQALVSMRRTVAMLRDDDGTSRESGYHPSDVPELVARFPGATLTVEPGPEPPPAVATTVYRVVLEALTNVRKHGKGVTAVEVRIEPGWRVLVEDDGSAPHRSPGGFGLIGLTERVEALGGTLTAGPSGRGWRVEAVLPGDAP